MAVTHHPAMGNQQLSGDEGHSIAGAWESVLHTQDGHVPDLYCTWHCVFSI